MALFIIIFCKLKEASGNLRAQLTVMKWRDLLYQTVRDQ